MIQVEKLVQETEDLKQKELDRGKRSTDDKIKKAHLDFEKETKKLKDDLDKIKRASEDKLEKLLKEHQSEVELKEFEHKDKAS
jgi:hypothetical protein